MKILTEASGSLTSGYIIKSIKHAGFQAVAFDIDNHIAARYLADDFILSPLPDSADFWSVVQNRLLEHDVRAVLPSLDETLSGWSERREFFSELGIHVLLSDPETIRICQDKWLTYLHFLSNGIPTPRTSLQQEFSLIKPRMGRGGVGVRVEEDKICMDGLISQEYVKGTEFTIDVLCDCDSVPVYIIPRRRVKVKDGKSVVGVTTYDSNILDLTQQICESLRFEGPVNIQCIQTEDGEVKFTEINPRLGGGMALGFAASENWIKPIVDNLIYGRQIRPVSVKYDLAMLRYYEEVYVELHIEE